MDSEQFKNGIEITVLAKEDFHTSVAATSRAFWPDPMFGFFAVGKADTTALGGH